MTAARSQVLVVGGGPSGASAAWSLASLGIDVTVLDRARFPRDKVCAEYLSPEASRVLHAMGALTAVEAAGATHLAGMIIRAPSGVRAEGSFTAAHGFRGFRDRGLALRRLILDEILLGRARSAGAAVTEGVRVTDVVRDANGRVTGVATIEPGGATAVRHADVIIGADGLRSVVARRLGLARSAPWPRRIAFVAHYRGVSGVGESGEMHVERDGYAGIARVGSGAGETLANVAVVVPAWRARRAGSERAGFPDRWLAARPHLAGRFAHAERVTPVRVTGPFASHARRAWVPGAVLVGDAADFFDPFTGEGIYAGLRGGELLAPFVADALRARGSPSADRALAAYDAARRREFSGKWRVERLVGAAVGFAPLMNRAAAVLATRRDMADLFVGVAGDFVPAREVLHPRYLLSLVLTPVSPSSLPRA